MNEETLLLELRRISCLDNLRCLGCGYEHSCSIHGCAIINEAVQRLETLTKSKANDPLTLEELLEMDGEPVWLEAPKYNIKEWCIAKWDEQMNRTRFWYAGGGWFDSKNIGTSLFAYRRKPEEGTT